MAGIERRPPSAEQRAHGHGNVIPTADRTGGARLRVARPGCPLRPGRVLEVALSCPARGLRVEVRLRLTHSAECAEGYYEVGGCFDCPLRAEDLAALTPRSPA